MTKYTLGIFLTFAAVAFADELPSHIFRVVDEFDGKETFAHTALRSRQYWTQKESEVRVSVVSAPMAIRDKASFSSVLLFQIQLPERINSATALKKFQIKRGDNLETYEFTGLFMSGQVTGKDAAYKIELDINGNQLQMAIGSDLRANVVKTLRESTAAAPVTIRFSTDAGDLTMDVPESIAKQIGEFEDWFVTQK